MISKRFTPFLIASSLILALSASNTFAVNA
ncbi:MAG: hypothetical protein ACJASB_003308, partial [Shewanella psychromarinicola]